MTAGPPAAGPPAAGPAAGPPRPWLLRQGAGFFFTLNLVYLVILVILLIGRWRAWPLIEELPDPIGGIIPLAVPWFGSLGAVGISLYGVFDHTRRGNWRPGWNYWHAGRPIVGTLMGTVGFLIFVGVINATGARPQLSGPATNLIPYMVLAFLVGYRESTFRDLIKRAADLLLAPGAASASASISPQRVDFGSVPLNQQPVERLLTVSNNGNADLEIGAGGVNVDGAGFALAPTQAANDISVAPRSTTAVKVQFVPTSAAAHRGSVTVQTSVGPVSAELVGTGA